MVRKRSVELKLINKCYGDKTVIKDFSFTFNTGSIYGLVGKNGIGKTTLLKIIASLIPFDSGTLIFPEEPYRVAYVSDEIDLPEYLTGLEFLKFLSKNWNSNVNFLELAKEVDIYHHLNTGIYTYSKGMKQKIRLIGSMISRPKMILLDEPLTGVDTESSSSIFSIINNLVTSGMIFVYASHVKDVFTNFKDINMIHLEEGSFNNVK